MPPKTPPTDSLYRHVLVSLGLLFHFTDIFTPLNKYRENLGDIFTAKFGKERYYFLFHPNHAKHIFSDNPQNFPKMTDNFVPVAWKVHKYFMGDGVLTTEGALWREQKKRASPNFLGSVVKSYDATLQYTLSFVLDSLRQKMAQGSSFDIEPVMRSLTFTVIGFSLFSEDLNQTAKPIKEVVQHCLKLFNRGVSGTIPLFWRHFPMSLRHHSDMKYLKEIIRRFYEARIADQNFPPDFLTTLLQAKDSLSFQQIYDEIMTILIGGHETTASALCWIIYLIATHPEWEEKLLKEWSFEGAVPTFEELKNFHHTRMVIKEAMRLYPPVWLLVRTCRDGDEIEGYEIKKDTNIVLSLYHLHRHSDFWKNPDQFDPERFHPSRLSSINEFAYLPFGYGGHLCLGRDLAMHEMMATIPAILKNFKVRVPPQAKIEMKCLSSIRPKYGMEVILEPGR